MKFDFHIHTPASKCFALKENQTAEQAYHEILDTALENNLEAIAITDHNTFAGFNELMCQIRLSGNKAKADYNRLLILCGIEITCF